MVDYFGAELTWFGRELAGYSKGNKAIAYQYDVDGMRYMKTVSENGTETARYDYVYSDGTLILLTHTTNGVANTARFVYDSFGEPRGFILNDSATYLYLRNGQGDITAIIGEDGEILVRYEYNAWGAVEFIVPFGVDPAVTSILATVSPFTYRGYCYDYDIGMYYLQSRYYDPQICRFINADSTDYLGATGTVLSYNLFAYCENDGVNNVDESGNVATSFKNTKNKTTIINICASLFESKANKRLFKNQYITYLHRKQYSLYSCAYDSAGKDKGTCLLYYNDTAAIPTAPVKKKRVVGKVICLTVKEWKAFLVSHHYTWFCKMQDLIERVIGEDGFDILLEWIELCAEAGGHPYIQCAAKILSYASEVFDYYRENFNTKFDNYIIRSIDAKKSNTMVAVVIYASYQSYRYNGRCYKWQTTKLIRAY